MPRKKKEVVFPGYVRVRYPDMEVLGILTKKAIGKNRSLTEFAEACGLAPSTISRVINAKFNNPISDGIIAAIAKNADPESGVTLNDLLAIHGLVPVRLVDEGQYAPLDTSKPYVPPKKERKSKFEGSTFLAIDTLKISKAIEAAMRSENADLFSIKVREIIQNALLESGYAVELHKDFNIVSLPQFRYLTPFTFTTNAVAVEGLSNWAFDIHDGYRFSLYQKLSWIFGTAYLDSPAARGTKVSIVTTDVDEFVEAKEKFSNIVIRDSISIILIDLDKKQVVEEFIIRQSATEAPASVFTD